MKRQTKEIHLNIVYPLLKVPLCCYFVAYPATVITLFAGPAKTVTLLQVSSTLLLCGGPCQYGYFVAGPTTVTLLLLWLLCCGSC